MNFKSQAQKLQDFLVTFSPLWNREIMNAYPQSLKDYPLEWINLLDSLSPAELFDIDSKKIPAKIEGTSFHHFMRALQELTQVECIPDTPEHALENWAFQGVKKKKYHEIQKIVPVLKSLFHAKKFEYVVDVGGGVGHLSRILSHYHQIPSISLDQNAEFQKIGNERLKKYRKLPGAANVEFINHTFGEYGDSEKLAKIFHPHSLSLGLHTCGALANTLINETIKNQTAGLLNFGCCYFRMNSELDFPLSTFYKENQFFKMNLFAFTLATRSHAQTSLETYATKEQVKNYRNALHLLLMKLFDRPDFCAVGECPIHVYSLPFSSYALMKLKELRIVHSLAPEQIDEFYMEPGIQRELRVMFVCNIIRWQLGRALEVFIQLDRCLYLEEKGFEVKLQQYFAETLSPRNLGILALSKRKPL